MRRGNMWLRKAFLVCTVIAAVLGDEDIVTQSRPGQEFVQYDSSVGESAPFQGRAFPVGDFVTSHKFPEGIEPPSDEDEEEEVEIAMEAELAKEVLQRAVENLDKRAEKKKAEQVKAGQQIFTPYEDDAISKKSSPKRLARVQLENFSDSGVLSKDGIKKIELARAKFDDEVDAIIPGVQVSAENPTTMTPVLTTSRDVRAFDFVPVNIIREDNKDAYTPYADRHFGDLSDVSLVPAGSNSRIQVKKGPNGKDYEYEYVYYYYDEEDEGKAGSQTNAHDGPAKTTPAAPTSRRGLPPGRNKYSSLDRSTTVEPATNEVIPSRTSPRGRQIPEAEDVPEERLPANTRFPPRSRSNHNTGTTEPSRARGNRPRPSLDLVDSSSFRTHQEGPEFPTNLPKGPLRFLGVTPNEDAEDKPAVRTRTRPSKVAEPAPVEEPSEEPVVPHRRRPVAAQPEVEIELTKGQPRRPSNKESEDDDEPTVEDTKLESASVEPVTEQESSSVESISKDPEVQETSTTEVPTTENPSAMDKVALDLYAFLLQGQSNLVDASTPDTETDDTTTPAEDEETTDVPTTTEVLTTTEATTTTTEPTTTTTTTTTTTEAPTTTTQLPVGRGKFRRPGTAGGINKNRFKSSGSGSTSGTTSTEASPAVEQTPRSRSRFGSNTGGFKRPRPGVRPQTEQPAAEEEAHKETSSPVNAERPSLAPRGRFRVAGSRTSTGTTAPSASTSAEESSSSLSSSAETTSTVARPAFNRLNLNRRRGRPTTPSPVTSAEAQESGETAQTNNQETVSTTSRPTVRPKLPGTGPRPLRPGPRINLRLRPGLTTSTTAAPVEAPEPSAEEPAGAGTEEESHEAPVETSPPLPTTPETPLTRLRNRNRLQVHPKAPRVVTPSPPRRSPLLPRRRTTEAPVAEVSSEQASAEVTDEETEPTEAALPETSTAASQKQEEVRGLSSLLAPRRRIAPRRPGQPISRE